MAKVRIILENDNGSITEREYNLDVGKGYLNDIEKGVSSIRSNVLSDIVGDLLNSSQNEFTKGIKKEVR